MNRRQKIIVSVVGIFIVLLALVGITYGYFLTRIQGNTNTKSISVTTADLKLVYDGDNGNIIGGQLLEPQEEGTEPFTKTFTVYNDGNVDINYGVYLIDVINTFERKDDIKYTIECTTDGTEPCGKVETATTFPSGIKELVTATIESKKTHTYTFKFTYYDTGTDQSVDMNKELSAKIQIFAEDESGIIIPFEKDTLAHSVLLSAVKKTHGTEYSETPLTNIGSMLSTTDGVEFIEEFDLSSIQAYDDTDVGATDCAMMGENYCGMHEATYGAPTSCNDVINQYVFVYSINSSNAIKVDGCNGEKPYTIVKRESSLTSAEDDYGTSYFYRGDVESNYVNFAGMCWRLTRIAGDGSMKLILQDKNVECDNISYTGDYSYETGNFGLSTYTGYNGFEDTTVNIINYLNPTVNADKSMATAFKNFQTTLKNTISNKYGKNINQMLKSGDWCIETDAYNEYDPNKEILSEINKNGHKILNVNLIYEAYGRITSEPTITTLKCNGTNMKDWGDTEKTPMYVGTLTVDEILHIGVPTSYDGMNMPKTFLDGEQWWYTLSPATYEYGEKIFAYQGNPTLSVQIANGNGSFRPAINLLNNVNMTGSGTIDEPYVIS